MPVFRKRVRDAFMVISVFSEWPESLGSLPVLCQKHYLASLPRTYILLPLYLLLSLCVSRTSANPFASYSPRSFTENPLFVNL